MDNEVKVVLVGAGNIDTEKIREALISKGLDPETKVTVVDSIHDANIALDGEKIAREQLILTLRDLPDLEKIERPKIKNTGWKRNRKPYFGKYE